MNLGELIQEFRIETDDNAEGLLFSDNEVRTWLNQGSKEVARRTHMIVDSSTASICTVNVTAGVSQYLLNSKIIYVKRVAIPLLQNKIIRPVKMELLDEGVRDWESRTGDPELYVVGMSSRAIQLYPVPTKDMVLKLTVIRLPLADMEMASDEPEIPEQYHQGLVQWALFRAYSKKDVEVYDDQMAIAAKRMFEGEFGDMEIAQAALEQLKLNNETYHFNTGAY